MVTHTDGSRTVGYHRWILVATLLLYALVTLHGLGAWPLVHEDEPWIASGAYKLARHGVYGSDLLAGYYGSENGLYILNPLYPLLLALHFKLVGFSLIDMRLLPAFFGALLLVMTYLVGKRTIGASGGLIAVVSLLLIPFANESIPFLDIARISRPDIAVPVVGMGAFLLFLKAESEKRSWQWIVVGALAGITSLFHLYGAFWLVSLVVLRLVANGWRTMKEKETWLMLVGFVLPWVPVAIWLAGGWEQFVGQSRFVADRFDLFSPSFYISNIVGEYKRYSILRPAPGWRMIASIVALMAIVVGAIVMLRRFSIDRCDGAFRVALVALVQGALFAIFIGVKNPSYLIAIYPLLTLIVGWVSVEVWRRWKNGPVRIAAIVLACVIAAAGVATHVERWNRSIATTPYDVVSRRLVAHVPPGARVLGLQHWWIGSSGRDYRSWLLPVMLSDSSFHHAPIPFDSALSLVDPDIILIDDRMRAYFADTSSDRSRSHAARFSEYMKRHEATLDATVGGGGYGEIEVWRLR